MMLNTKQDNSSIIVVHLYSVLLNNIWVVFSGMFVFWWVHVNYVYRNLTVKLQQQLNACLMRLTECFLKGFLSMVSRGTFKVKSLTKPSLNSLLTKLIPLRCSKLVVFKFTFWWPRSLKWSPDVKYWFVECDVKGLKNQNGTQLLQV